MRELAEQAYVLSSRRTGPTQCISSQRNSWGVGFDIVHTSAWVSARCVQWSHFLRWAMKWSTSTHHPCGAKRGARPIAPPAQSVLAGHGLHSRSPGSEKKPFWQMHSACL